MDEKDFHNLVMSVKSSEYVSIKMGDEEIQLYIYDRFKNAIGCKVCIRTHSNNEIRRFPKATNMKKEIK